MIHRQNLLHRRKTFLRVARCAQILFLVQQIVLDDQPGLRVQIRPLLRHQFQVVVRRQRAVLDLRASCESRRTHCILIRVHQRPQPLLLRLIARRVQLFLRKRHPSALPYALRRENLDRVRARLLLFPHERAYLFRRTCFLPLPEQRLYSCKNPRPGQFSFRDRVAQRNIVCRAQALNRSEPRHQRHPCIRRRLIRILLRRPSHSRIFPIFSKIPRNVRVRVNPPRQHCQPAQVVVHGPGALVNFCLNRRNLLAFHHNARVTQHLALPIEHRARRNHNPLVLAGRWRLRTNSLPHPAHARQAEKPRNDFRGSHICPPSIDHTQFSARSRPRPQFLRPGSSPLSCRMPQPAPWIAGLHS